MGNCITSKRVLDQKEKDDPQKEAEANKGTRLMVTSSKLESESQTNGGKKKMVRFKSHEQDSVDRESYGNSKSGVVRIKVVVKLEELNQILSNESQYSSAEEMFRAIKLRSREISQARTSDRGMNVSWRPALEIISEDL